MTSPTPNTTIIAENSQPDAVARRRLRCLTLLEVLIALVLLAGLTALVLPSMLDRLDERAFEAAADTASEQLMMARAHAQATGEAVEVTYSPSTGQVHARVYAPWSSEIDFDSNAMQPGTSPLRDPSSRSRNASGANRESSDDAASAGSGTSEAGDAQAHAIAEPWASRALGSGISIARRPSAFPFAADNVGESSEDHGLSTLAGGSSSDDYIETLADLERGQEVRLAVFMPDGSALVGDEVFLNDQSGRCGRLSVNPWSGLPMFVRLAARNAARGEGNADADTANTPSRDDANDANGDADIDRAGGDDASDASRRDWGDENDD